VFDERETEAPAWAWLRGFGLFLVAWPLLGLLAADRFDLDDLESILIALLGPAAIGVALLALEATLTRLFSSRARPRVEPLPNILRDVANTALAILVLGAVDVLWVLVFGAPVSSLPRAAARAATFAAVGSGVAVAFRALARVVHGRPRRVDLGPGWDLPHSTLRFVGSLSLVPTLFLGAVLVQDTILEHGELGPAAWIAVPVALFIGLRSAMARAPRFWAPDPWRAWRRRISLSLPWWILAVVVALGFSALTLTVWTGWVEELTRAGKIIAFVVLVPLGLVVLLGTILVLGHELPNLIRAVRLAQRLERGELPASFEVVDSGGSVRVKLAHAEAVFAMGPHADATIAWLREATSARRELVDAS